MGVEEMAPSTTRWTYITWLSPQDVPKYDILRCWGYVIWSNETLGTLRLLEKGQSTDCTYQRLLLLGNRERPQGKYVSSRVLGPNTSPGKRKH